MDASPPWVFGPTNPKLDIRWQFTLNVELNAASLLPNRQKMRSWSILNLICPSELLRVPCQLYLSYLKAIFSLTSRIPNFQLCRPLARLLRTKTNLHWDKLDKQVLRGMVEM
jgi:hypothetical protein